MDERLWLYWLADDIAKQQAGGAAGGFVSGINRRRSAVRPELVDLGIWQHFAAAITLILTTPLGGNMRAIIAIVVLSLATAACSPSSETDVTGATGACAARLYSPFDPKDMKQCVDVCLKCDRGVMTTCSTSCTLKGAR